MVRVSIVTGMKMIMKAINPITNRTGLEKASSEIRAYVKSAVIAEENRILMEDFQSTDTPNCFLMNRKLMNKLGRLTVNEVAIKPMTPKLEINRKLSGKPIATVRMESFMLYVV